MTARRQHNTNQHLYNTNQHLYNTSSTPVQHQSTPLLKVVMHLLYGFPDTYCPVRKVLFSEFHSDVCSSSVPDHRCTTF